MRARCSPDLQQELFTPVKAAEPAVSTGVLHKEWKMRAPKNTLCINNTLASTPPHVRKHKVDTWAVTHSPVRCAACWQQYGGARGGGSGQGVWPELGDTCWWHHSPSAWCSHTGGITRDDPTLIWIRVLQGQLAGCYILSQHSCTRTDTLRAMLD